jgi:baculoviral IAP repeat-containing protein 6
LILVPEPYFNEPGYASKMGTKEGKHCSKSYNENILLQTIVHAMVAQLQRPSPGFEDVIRAHFRIKKERILKVKDNNTACLIIQYVKEETQPTE